VAASGPWRSRSAADGGAPDRTASSGAAPDVHATADAPKRGRPTLATSIRERAAFDFVRYGSVWEDADVLCEALAPVARGGRLLSIASAGDNALALLTLDPAEVVAVDLSPAQLACLELRIAAFRRLDHDALPAFLGVTPSGSRLETYRRLRADLGPSAGAFWDAHPRAVARGVIHAGKFESYLRGFRRWVLPLVHSQRTIEHLCRPASLEEQRRFYDRTWDSWRWRALFQFFFSRAVMGRLGRDPAFFRHVGGPVGARILARSRYALTELPVSTNPFLTYIMTGSFAPQALPRYLRPEWRVAIRTRLERVRVVEGDVAQLDIGRFDGHNLSDIFEYMSAHEHERCYRALISRARPGARLAYWNMLVPRGCPPDLGGRVRPLDDLALSLHARDRAWFYQHFHLDELMRGGTP
jgi:S-adenosylmethionine-diacylglycerol 3-amino-3-carboxypropyl transferase